MLTAEQIGNRRVGIGGSDAASAANIPGAFKTPLELWEIKTGRVTPPDISNLPHVHFGNVLEPVLADEFVRRTGKRVRRANQLFRHSEHDFMLGYVDRLIVGERAGLEIKTTNAFNTAEWGADGTDEVPMPYLVQCAHYMAVTDRDEWYVGVLIGGSDFRIYRIARDPALEAMLVQREAEFWQYVVNDTPPPAVNASDLQRLHPGDNGSVVEATPEIIEAHSQLVQLKSSRDLLNERIEAVENRIKAHIGDAAELKANGVRLATWKTSRSTRLDTKRLKAERPGIFAEFSTESTTRRFLA